MQSRHAIAAGVTLGLLIALMSSCDKNPTQAVDRAADEAAIRAIIAADLDVFHELGIDDAGAQAPEYDATGLPKSGDYIEPVRYGRRGKYELESVDIQFSGVPGEPDTIAIATITKTFTGTFVVAAKDTDSTTPEAYKVYEKPVRTTVVRKALLRRVAYTDNPRRNWCLVAVTMSEGVSDQTTINVASLRVEASGQEPLVITDPLEYWRDRHQGLPVFAQGDTVKVYVALTNSNHYPPEPGTTVLVHFGVDRWWQRGRRPLNDNGVYPDMAAGDGVFSGSWVVGHGHGLRHLVIDAIDNGTIYDDRAPYNAVCWGMVYGREK
ncbi:MAG: choice-of-anchor X domain-containing protein [Candidatus Oleimicrobiaceae bacterium]